MNHYLQEGVRHFYLIDNGSTDNYRPVLEPYITAGIVTLWIDGIRHAQVALYNKYMMPLMHQTTWLIVCDLDEFFYGQTTVAEDVIKLAGDVPNLGAVCVSWKMFGSSGHVTQPSSVVQSFTKRRRAYMPACGKGHGKCIVRTQAVQSIGIHGSSLTQGYFTCYDTAHLGPIQLNHYRIQSYNWFRDIKMTRGAADHAASENVRTAEYFQLCDKNELDDTELKDKRRRQ